MLNLYKNICSGKKSKSFIYINKLNSFSGIPKNLILDTDLNILKLQPNLELIKKSENFWKQHNYKNYKFYNTITKFQKNRYRYLIDIINKIVKIKKLKKILDYGCGDLTFLKMMIKSIKVKTLDGHDINIKKTYSKKIRGKKINIYDKIDIKKKGGYDLISLNWVLTNTFAPWKILSKCRNLLKDGAYLTVTDSNVIMNKKPIKKVDTYFKFEDLKMVKFLSKIADINVKNKKGHTPLDVARSMNFTEIVKVLEKKERKTRKNQSKNSKTRKASPSM